MNGQNEPFKTHHIVEIQSDWAQARDKMFRTDEDALAARDRVDEIDATSPARLTYDEMRALSDDEFQAYRNEIDPLDKERKKLMDRLYDYAVNGTRDEFDADYPAPFVKDQNQWVEAALRQNLMDAVESGADYITLPAGAQAARYTDMPDKAAKKFYDQDVIKSMSRVMRSFSREAGIEVPELEVMKFVDKEDVMGLRITPELAEAIRQYGFPTFKKGGLVGATAAERLMSGEDFFPFQAGGPVLEPRNLTPSEILMAQRKRT